MNFLDFPNEQFQVSQTSTPDGLSSGEVVRFNYDGETKSAIVLVGNWKGKLHALALLDDLSEDLLLSLLNSLSKKTGGDAIQIRSEYESSSYTKTKSYRTYSPDKISQIKIVKQAPRKPKKR